MEIFVTQKFFYNILLFEITFMYPSKFWTFWKFPIFAQVTNFAFVIEIIQASFFLPINICNTIMSDSFYFKFDGWVFLDCWKYLNHHRSFQAKLQHFLYLLCLKKEPIFVNLKFFIWRQYLKPHLFSLRLLRCYLST